MAELLWERILHGFNAHCTLGPGFPLYPALIHHTRLHRHAVAPRDEEVQQELSAEIVVMRLHPLLNLIDLGLERNLKGKYVRSWDEELGLGDMTMQYQYHEFSRNTVHFAEISLRQGLYSQSTNLIFLHDQDRVGKTLNIITWHKCQML